jgi:hypothetical protein
MAITCRGNLRAGSSWDSNPGPGGRFSVSALNKTFDTFGTRKRVLYGEAILFQRVIII